MNLKTNGGVNSAKIKQKQCVNENSMGNKSLQLCIVQLLGSK